MCSALPLGMIPRKQRLCQADHGSSEPYQPRNDAARSVPIVWQRRSIFPTMPKAQHNNAILGQFVPQFVPPDTDAPNLARRIGFQSLPDPRKFDKPLRRPGERLYCFCSGIGCHSGQKSVQTNEIVTCTGRPFDPHAVLSSRTRRGQRLGARQAVRPGLNLRLINHGPGIDISEGLERHAMALVLKIDPGGKRLFDDPATRSIQSCRHLIDLVGERQGHMSGEDFGCHRIGQSFSIAGGES
jgi:hypothetical protein